MNAESPISNADRADRANNVLETYNDEFDPTSNAIDLLADLQHYCRIARATDINHRTFDELLEIARQHFTAEIEGEE